MERRKKRSSRKRPSATSAPQVLLGRGDHAQIELDRLVGADPHDLPLVQGTQQLGLHVQRQVVELVDEQRPALAHLQRPAALVRRRR